MILFLLLSIANAEQSVASWQLRFTVPVVCSVENNEPKCNLVLEKINQNTWVDQERGYKITLTNSILSVEAL